MRKKLTFFVPTIVVFSFLMVAFARQPDNPSIRPHRLAITIDLSKSFTVPAATTGHTLETFLRVSANANGGNQNISAVKLAPKMAGDKIEITVSTISGDTSLIKTCKDWDLLKESPVASYTLKEGEEITVKQLSNLGPNFKNGMVTFKVVSAPDIEEIEGGGGTACGCGRCGDLECCPNKGACLGCGQCGDVCCRITN